MVCSLTIFTFITLTRAARSPRSADNFFGYWFNGQSATACAEKAKVGCGFFIFKIWGVHYD